MMNVLTRKTWWLLAALASLAASMPQSALLAQGLDDADAVETIIGSEVDLDQSGARQEADSVVAALDNTAASIREVRKTFKLDKVEFVLLPDIDQAGSAIARKTEEHEEEIGVLREAIQGNPIFYHAADSHSVLIGDIIALEFDDENGVKIYTAGEASTE